MVLLEALVVVLVVGLLTYGTVLALTRPRDERAIAITAGTWRVGHYESDGATLVVVQRVGEDGRVLDEHLVEAVPIDDAEYDERFLSAMAAARQRRALFEASEDDG